MYRAKRRAYAPRRSMEERLNLFLCLILLLGVLPVFITTFFQRLKLEDLLFRKPGQEISEIEARLPELVAKQISIHMPDEAIKAQSVLARTNLLAAMQKEEAIPTGYTTEELQNLWGEQFDNYYKKIQELIAETKGETLQYKGEYIYAAYHQSSAGNTRSITEYYEKSAMPYLTGAACHEDTTAEGYLNVFFWTKEEFLGLCENAFPDAKVTGGEDVIVQKRDSAGYVLEVKVGQTVCEGETFRKKLNLPSACFEITCIDENVRLVTLGQGHGFGLSQYTACKMAEQGKSYQEILEYFYKGVALTE